MGSQFYSTEKLGKKRSKTPEGFLLCEDVAIARTGMMVYGPNETPIEAGPDGLVRIFREEDEVFRPETIASYHGKAVTVNHPEVDVNPSNWKELAVGTCINPRRGVGAYDDLLLADLLITSPETIQRLEDELPEVSCGYEADYEEAAPGVGYQRNIVGNHVALVEQGRCGPRCAIGDQLTVTQTKKEIQGMAKKTLLQRALDAFHAKDEGALAEVMAEKAKDEGELEAGGDTHIHIHANGEPMVANQDEVAGPAVADPAEGGSTLDDEVEARFARLEEGHAQIMEMLQQLMGSKDAEGEGEGEGEVDPALDEESEELKTALKDEAPAGLEEEATKAKDSKYLAESYKDTVAAAEILCPGIKAPTFDAASKPGASFKAICGFRRQALDKAYTNPTTRELIGKALAGKTFDTKNMSCDAVRHVFLTASLLQGQANNASMATRTTAKALDNGVAQVKSLADVNKMNAARWGHNK